MNTLPELDQLFVVEWPDVVDNDGQHDIRLTLRRILSGAPGALTYFEKLNGHSYDYYAVLPRDWNWSWVVKGKGVYVGTLPKRISKYIKTTFDYSLTPEQLSEIGNIARRYSAISTKLHVDLTATFDWYRGDFGDDGSCFWGSNEGARELLEEHGALAIRLYKAPAEGSYTSEPRGCGRAWILPPDAHAEGDFYIVFNGYGGPTQENGHHTEYETLAYARLLADIVGATYKKIDFYNNGDSDGLLYINGGRAYAVGDAETLRNIEQVNLRWGTYDLCCENCGDRISEDESYYYDGESYCESCYVELFRTCDGCDSTFARDDLTYVPDTGDYCESCLNDRFYSCDRCGHYVETEETKTVRTYAYYSAYSEQEWCPRCRDRHATYCETCEAYYADDMNHECEDETEDETEETEPEQELIHEN